MPECTIFSLGLNFWGFLFVCLFVVVFFLLFFFRWGGAFGTSVGFHMFLRFFPWEPWVVVFFYLSHYSIGIAHTVCCPVDQVKRNQLLVCCWSAHVKDPVAVKNFALVKSCRFSSNIWNHLVDQLGRMVLSYLVLWCAYFVENSSKCNNEMFKHNKEKQRKNAIWCIS